MAKAEKRKKPDTRVPKWLKGYRRQRAVLLWLGSFGTLLLSVPVLFLTWWVIWLVLFLPMMLLGLKLEGLVVASWVGLGLLFVAQVFLNRQRLETLKFDEPGPGVVAAQFAAHIAGMHSLAMFINSPEMMRSQFKVIGLVMLSGPALIGLSWRLACAALAAQRMNIDSVGNALSELLVAERRVLVDDLAARVASPNPPQLLRELLLIDGVILLTSGDPSLTLTDSLRAEVTAGIERIGSEEA